MKTRITSSTRLSRVWRKLLKLLPFLVAIVLVIIVYSDVNLTKWASELKKINFFWFLLLIIVGLLQGAISTLGWFISLRVLKLQVNFFRLFYYYLLGGFVSYILPGTVGGDAAKLFMVGRKDKKYNDSFVSLVMQRIIGVFVALSCFFIPAVALTQVIDSWQLKIILVSGAFLIIAFILLFIFSEKLGQWVYRLFRLFRIDKLNGLMEKILFSFSCFRDHKTSLFLMALTSLAFQTVSLLFRFIIMVALHIDIPFWEFIGIVIIVTVIVQIPISFAGIGLREGSYKYFYTSIGISAEKALAFSLLEYLPGFVINSLAALVFIVSRSLKWKKL
jgi:uncharacterized protein (TIRG00374 family)